MGTSFVGEHIKRSDKIENTVETPLKVLQFKVLPHLLFN